MKGQTFDFHYSHLLTRKPPTLIIEVERTIVCVDCGASVRTKARVRKRCDACRLKHDVAKTAKANVKLQAQRRAARTSRSSGAPRSGSNAD